jgi:hypothetical protein
MSSVTPSFLPSAELMASPVISLALSSKRFVFERFDIAMNNPGVVDNCQRFGDLRSDLDHLIGGEIYFGQCGCVDQLHHHVRAFGIFTDVVHRYEIGVAYRRRGACFSDQPLALRVVWSGRMGTFDGDTTVESCVHRFPGGGHTARSADLNQFVPVVDHFWHQKKLPTCKKSDTCGGIGPNR